MIIYVLLLIHYFCCFYTNSVSYGHLKQDLSSEERKKILLDVADALEAHEDLIRSENEADVAAAQGAGYDKSLVARLTLKQGKVGPVSIYISSHII